MYEVDPRLAAEISAISLEPETEQLLHGEAEDGIYIDQAALMRAAVAAQKLRYRGVQIEYEKFGELDVKLNSLLRPLDTIRVLFGQEKDGLHTPTWLLDLMLDDERDASFVVTADNKKGEENLVGKLIHLAAFSQDFTDQFRSPPIEKHKIKPGRKLVLDTNGNNFHGHENDRLWFEDPVIGLWIGEVLLKKYPIKLPS